MTTPSVVVPLDEVRKLIESNIRIEGTTNEIKKDLGRFEFRMDSHDQRIGAIEKGMIHNAGVHEGRQDVKKKVDKWGLAIIAAIATIGAGLVQFIGHKLGLV